MLYNSSDVSDLFLWPEMNNIVEEYGQADSVVTCTFKNMRND